MRMFEIGLVLEDYTNVHKKKMGKIYLPRISKTCCICIVLDGLGVWAT